VKLRGRSVPGPSQADEARAARGATTEHTRRVCEGGATKRCDADRPPRRWEGIDSLPLKALLLAESAELARACADAGFEIVYAESVASGRALATRERFAIVDARVARPRPLDEELQQRVDAFFERLRGHAAGGLYDAVMREVEKPLIAGALARANGVRAAAAAELGIDRGTLARRMRALGLDET
jgi:Fis family transcriptional regulator, factor for inversion stimulation protein